MSGFILVSTIYIYNVYFFTFSDIDREFIQKGPGPVISPTERYTANAYYEPYGGAVGGVNVWVEITDHNDNNEKKTIYYSDVNINFDIEWIDENTLSIINEEPDYPSYNKSIKLDVEKEIYHDRGLAFKSWLMKDEYETCYQEYKKKTGKKQRSGSGGEVSSGSCDYLLAHIRRPPSE